MKFASLVCGSSSGAWAGTGERVILSLYFLIYFSNVCIKQGWVRVKLGAQIETEL